VSRLLTPLLLLIGFGVVFAANTLGGSMLGFDDHPGQLYRVWHVMTNGPAPWAWNRGWWAGYPELQFYPPGAAYLTALLAWPARGVVSLETVYHGVVWLTYLLPGVTTLVALSRLAGSAWLALPGAFVALTLSAGVTSGVEGGVHVGMVGARLAWALLPLLLWVLVPWIDGDRPAPPAVPFILGAIVLLHPAQLPTAVALVALAGGWRAPRRRRALQALSSLGAAAALTAFWTLPLLARLAETRALAWGTLTLGDLARPLPLVLLGLAVAGLLDRAPAFPSERVALWWLPVRRRHAVRSLRAGAARPPVPAVGPGRGRRVDDADSRRRAERRPPGPTGRRPRAGAGARPRGRAGTGTALAARRHARAPAGHRHVAPASESRARAPAPRLRDGAEPAAGRPYAVRAVRRAARARP